MTRIHRHVMVTEETAGLGHPLTIGLVQLLQSGPLGILSSSRQRKTWSAYMLEAELRGKMPEEVADNEDLLTSAAFGLLKYVPPSVFWPAMLNRAKSRSGMSFTTKLKLSGVQINSYDKITLHFWPGHARHGQPDILIVLQGGGQLPLFFIIEVKLWSQKSGHGLKDQLSQYLQALDDFQWLRDKSQLGEPFLTSGVIYLTPRVAWDEIDESIECAGNPQRAKNDLFNLQWQDVSETARSLSSSVREPYDGMLMDVARLLEYKGLQHFYGFTELSVPMLLPVLRFYPEKQHFGGFTQFDFDLAPQSAVNFYETARNKSRVRRAR